MIAVTRARPAPPGRLGAIARLRVTMRKTGVTISDATSVNVCISFNVSPAFTAQRAFCA